MPTPNPKQRLINSSNISFLKTQIESGQGGRTKKALQDLCKLYRDGFSIAPHDLTGMEQSIVGLLYTQGKEEKIRRWALNALARLGREARCGEAILHTLKTYSTHPETAAAAIAALYKLNPNQAPLRLKSLDFDPKMVTLSALQHVSAAKLDLSALPLDIDTASPEQLKLALLVVGLDRAPPNMLNPRHSNPAMVKVLGSHHDNIVCQYSVWAICENSSLGVSDLGIKILDIEQQPGNVRSWMFQLLAISPKDAANHVEYLELGTRDPETDSRLGLARGLKKTYFDGLDPVVTDWFLKETDEEVNHYILDHMIQQSERSFSYKNLAIEVYEKEPSRSQLRLRMEAMAEGLPIYSKFRHLDVDGSDDLFRRTIVNNTYNISGGIQGGAVSVGGDAKNQGPTNVTYSSETISAIHSELSKAERYLHDGSLQLNDDLKADALEKIKAAAAAPEANNIAKVVDVLKKIEAVTGKAVEAAVAIGGIAATLAKLAGLF